MTELLARLTIWLEDVMDRVETWMDGIEDRVYEIRKKRGEL